MLSASASNNHSLLSFGRNADSGRPKGSSGSCDFLPSVSFDDLQSSIESVSTELKLTDSPAPRGQGSILAARGMMDRRRADPSSATQNGGTTRTVAPSIATRPTRSGSIIRRPSISNRQLSVTSRLSSSGPVDAPTAPVAMRERRSSHYPPVSSDNIGKPPRKSTGPGVIGDADVATRSHQRRRPSLLADRGSGDSFFRDSMDGLSSIGSDATRTLNTTRAAKARSVQPPSRTSLAPNDAFTPEQKRLSSSAPKSPRGSGRGTAASSSGKRASMMPGSHNSSHATGLGARTISPTDARRMRRLSTMPQSQSLNEIINVPPPPPLSFETRAESRSPSMIPRKTSVTPSSARTTPDPNRKSYSSGLSVGSNQSCNTVRTSTGSLQPRLPQSLSTSRLPAPKLSSGQNLLPAEGEDDVPPVPAIPKLYESSRDAGPAEHYSADNRKSALGAAEASNIHTSVSGDISMLVLPEPTKVQRDPSARKSSYAPSTNISGDKSGTGSQFRKQLQPLGLPPLNLGPLNLPASRNNVTASRGLGSSQRDMSPPPSRQLAKTPSTPLTASKSTFFSKSRHDEILELPSLRSSTSAHHIRTLTPTPPGASSSDSSLDLGDSEKKSSISPFLSSSAPKTGLFEHSYLHGSKAGTDHETSNGASQEHRNHQKPAGPRAPNVVKPMTTSAPSEATVPEQPQTPSSMSSLRRKLSMTWNKRASSKGSINVQSDATEKTGSQQMQLDSMPPPRIPISSTVNNLSNIKQKSPSPTAKLSGGYLESRRRKSSAASLTNAPSHERTKSDNWKKGLNDSITMSSREPGKMTRLLKTRASSSAMRNLGSNIMELDKDDLAAEEEMRKMGSRRKETEIAAKALDALIKRATPKERVGPHEAIRIASLNIYERGEIVDYPDIYFCGTQHARKVTGDLQTDAPNFGYDDERGDYTIVTGDHLAYRYEVVDILGKGSFGQVVRCIDHKLGALIAVKIIRNKKRFHQQGIVEVNILQKLREWVSSRTWACRDTGLTRMQDPKNRHSMVNFTQSFYFRGHFCISTELLDMNLYEFTKAHSFRGFSLRIVRRFAKQILNSLSLLRQHKIIHCDLKPENILLRHPLHSEIKVIDFGSSCFENEKVYTYIQSRFYRSPEVILGMTYGMPIDMWSVGCILAELYTGVPLFPGENEQEQLACIMEVFGPPEKHLVEKSTRKKLFFDSLGKPRLTVSSKGRRRRPSSKTLQQVLKCDDEAFLDFLARCLRWDPDRRMRPEDALRHEFITGKKASSMPARASSPVKRYNTTSSPRPLPEPPGTKGPPLSLRTGASPHKSSSSVARRASGVTAPTAASANKRASIGATNLGAGPSSLPRAAGRSASGKQDIAAAGATAAMSRRA